MAPHNLPPRPYRASTRLLAPPYLRDRLHVWHQVTGVTL